MPRAALFTVLVALILTGSLQAQRRGGMFQGHAAGVGIHPGFAAQRGIGSDFPRRSGFFPRSGFFSRPGFFSRNGFSQTRFHHRHDGFGSVAIPYFIGYDEPYWYEEPYPEEVANVPAPLVVIQQSDERQAPAPAAIPASPQLIEVPGTAIVAKPLPPTIFILTNGERVEGRRYFLTANNLSLTIGRQQRTIPVDVLDIDATVTANRERGIDLQIPADRNEISLSF